MKKYCIKLTKIFTLALFAFLLSFSLINNFTIKFDKTLTKSNASSISADFSIFISNATYSTFYNNKIYFIDSYDNLLKIYDTNNKKFLNEYLDLTEYEEIVDATYLDGNIFLYSSLNQLVIINLNDLSIKTISNELLTNSLSKISVTKINDEDLQKFAITLSPDIINEQVSPVVMLIDETSLELSEICKINLVSNDFDDIKTSLIKIFVLNSQTVDNEINIMFFYGSNVAFASLSINSLKNNETISSVTLISAQLDNTNHNINIKNINLMQISNNSYYLITYSDNSNNAYSRLYRYKLTNSIETSFEYLSQIETSNTKYVLTSNEYVIFPNDNQSITYVKIEYDDENEIISNINTTITNPIVTPEYFEEENFVYMQTNKNTKLLSSPWDFDEIIIINENIDIINIGKGKIESENSVIEDFLYCLYTFDGVNYKGYIKTEDLTEKQIIPVENYPYPVFKTVPNSNLYSLPTKVLGDMITNDLSSSVIMQIEANSRVEVLDVICGYTSLDSTMIKVKVNNNQIGYIETNNIIHPSDKVDYVITNSAIKQDKTNVYINANSNSAIIYTLDKGYRIRINGVRDTKTGYTSITFNDEYGNEFSGYIITDVISADSWTTLQIVGCILIAINIGLLILILLFKKEKIGGRGQKYTASEITNYGKTNITNSNIKSNESNNKQEDEK